MKNKHFDIFFRVARATLLGFILAFALTVLAMCAGLKDKDGTVMLLLGWPVITWRLLRRQSTPAREKPTLAQRAVLPLVALPIALAIPVFALISAVDGGAGGWGIVLIITLIVLSGVFAFCWGAAFIAYLAGLGTRKKKP
jgi:hypothetical protein